MGTQLAPIDANAPSILTINGRSLAQLGCVPRRLDGYLSSPTTERAVQAAPTRFGVSAAPYVTVAPRTIVVTVDVYAATMADRHRALESLRRALAGLLDVTTSDMPGTVCRMVCTGFSVLGSIMPDRPLADSSITVDLTFTGYDAARYLEVPTPFAVTAAQPVPVMLGDLPSPAQYVHFGPHTGDLVLTWTGGNGIVLETCTLNGTLSSGERWVLDFARDRLWRVNGAGVASNVYGTVWQGGTWLTFSPGDAAFDPRETPEAWPQFGISTGSGVLFVREAYAY